MSAIRYRITLREPAIFAAPEGEPNSAVSLDFIPGSAVRGMVIGAYARTFGAIDPADSRQETVRRLFFSDSTRFLNAHVVEQTSDTRSLPVPLSWVQPKDDPKSILDQAVIQTPDGLTKKSVKGFVVVDGTTALVTQPKRVLNVHTQRVRRSSSEAQLYRYDALAALQIFEGVILCDEAEDAETLFALLDDLHTITLGGASNAGYGHAEIQLMDDNLFMDWSETPQAPVDAPPVLTLLSDVIIRDKNGSYRPTCSALEQALGVEIVNEKVYLDTTMVGGFNRKWGLPLPQTPAFKRGSVFLLKNGPVMDISLLQQGIGERRNEGFGRFAVGWQVNDHLQVQEAQPAQALQNVREASELSRESRSLWRQMNRRLREQQLEESWVSVAYEAHYKITGPITKTQIAHLRARIADALRQPDPKTTMFAEFLDTIKGRAAGHQFDRSYIGGRSLDDWLRSPYFSELPSKPQRRPYVMLRLVDAVLERAQKERSGRNE